MLQSQSNSLTLQELCSHTKKHPVSTITLDAFKKLQLQQSSATSSADLQIFAQSALAMARPNIVSVRRYSIYAS